MNYFVVIAFSIISYVAADTQPLPYPPASQSVTYNAQNENLQTVSGPYLQQYAPGPEGFNIQSGFEGYLVPSATGTHTILPLRESLEALSGGLSGSAGIFKIIKPFTKIGLKIIPKIGALILGVVALFIIGGIFTTAICSFTPICHISFLGWGFSRESMRSYLTQDRISATAAFVLDAIKKYKELYDTSANEIINESEKKSRK